MTSKAATSGWPGWWKYASGFLLLALAGLAAGYLSAHHQSQLNSPARAISSAAELARQRCTACHLLPEPRMLARRDWAKVMQSMRKLVKAKAGLELAEDEWSALLQYHESQSLQDLPKLPPDPAFAPLRFAASPLGNEAEATPKISSVALTDLDRDGRPDILVTDMGNGVVSWIRKVGDRWEESELCRLPAPARAETFDFDSDGDLDIVVSVLGSPTPTDALVGRVVLLVNDGKLVFSPRTLLESVGRVADARPGDLDGDGDIDFSVTIFGHVLEGRVGWLRQGPDGSFRFQALIDRPGGIHVPVVDLDRDGALDVVALISQDTEQVEVLRNMRDGTFEPHVAFRAGTPLFGSSGIQLVDLDRDGDIDILYTNGDSFDIPELDAARLVRPYHGVQWLENLGDFRFERRELTRFYGAYSAVAGDLDGDGDLDVVVASLFNDWNDKTRNSVIWLENVGDRRFEPRSLAREPTHVVTLALGDLDGDGRLDVVGGGLHAFPPYDRRGRVTWWRNLGP